MKKIIILLLILESISMKGFSQLAVTDPGVTAATTTGNSIQTVSQTIQRIMAQTEVSLLDGSMFDDMTTVMDILGYIDQIACQTSELRFNMLHAKNFSCLTMLNMKDVTMSLNYSSQIISKLFTSFDIISMNKGDRIKSLTDVLNILKKVSAQLGETNLTITGYLSKKVAQDYLNNINYLTAPHSVGDRYRK